MTNGNDNSSLIECTLLDALNYCQWKLRIIESLQVQEDDEIVDWNCSIKTMSVWSNLHHINIFEYYLYSHYIAHHFNNHSLLI